MAFLNKNFWLGETGVIVRAIRTAAQTAIALLGVSQFSLFSVDWKNVLGVSGASAFLSILMSLDRSSEPARITVTEVMTPTAAPQPVQQPEQPRYPVW